MLSRNYLSLDQLLLGSLDNPLIKLFYFINGFADRNPVMELDCFIPASIRAGKEITESVGP